MRVVLEGNGRLVVDILPDPGTARRAAEGRNAPQAPRTRWRTWHRAPGAESGEVFQVGAYGSAEEALFAGLMFVLRRYRERIGQIPTHEVMIAVVRTAEELLTSGKLPPAGEGDRTFLAMLLAVLEQVAGRFGIRWLDTLIGSVRATIVDFDNPDLDGNDDDDDGNGGPDGDDGGNAGPDGSGSRGNGTPGGGNGVPTRKSRPADTQTGKKKKK